MALFLETLHCYNVLLQVQNKNADLACTEGAAVNLPVVALLVHSPILHTPDLPVFVSVKTVKITAINITAIAIAVATATAAAAAAAVAQLSQRYTHLLIFF